MIRMSRVIPRSVEEMLEIVNTYYYGAKPNLDEYGERVLRSIIGLALADLLEKSTNSDEALRSLAGTWQQTIKTVAETLARTAGKSDRSKSGRTPSTPGIRRRSAGRGE